MGKTHASITIGVRTKEFVYPEGSIFPGHTKHGWGYNGNRGTAHHEGSKKSYSVGFTSGDVIQMLLDLDIYTLSFIKNGRNLGLAHTLPAETELFPCIATFEQGQSVVTLQVEAQAEAVTSQQVDAPDQDLMGTKTEPVVRASA